MAHILAVTGAVTVASRLAKELERQGCIHAQVIHTPTYLGSGGCSYSVRIPTDCLETLLNVSSAKNIRIKKLYKESNENGERVYHDIS